MAKVFWKILILSVYIIYPLQIFSIEPLSSNQSSLNGHVYDEETGETLIGASVFLKSTKYGDYTNKGGFYSIINIEPGNYTVIVSFIGYEKFEGQITLKKGASVRKDFELSPSEEVKDEIEVTAKREIEEKIVSVSKINVPVEQIKNIRLGGEADVFRSLQYLPGILTSSQISSGLFVRGGSPDQNLVLLDGSVVYNPSHLFGFISTFNSDAIKDVELIKGGFPAEYGGRLSAVLTLTQKDGNKKEVEGLANIGALSSKLALQGPVGNGSWYIGGRRTYFEFIKLFISEDPEEPIPDFNFYDINAKISQNINDNNKLFLSGFLSADELDYASFGLDVGLDLGNRSSSLRWESILADDLYFNALVSYSNYFNVFTGSQSGYDLKIDNQITDKSFKAKLEWNLNEDMFGKFGIEISNLDFQYSFFASGQEDSAAQSATQDYINFDLTDWNYSAFSQFSYKFLEYFTMQAGLRLNYWALSDEVTYGPRMALRYQIFGNLAAKIAWGIYHQNLRLAAQPDFSFFDTWMPTDASLPPSNAQHYIFSLETQPAKGYDLNLDFYYKGLENVSELNRTIIQAEVVSDIFFIGTAESYGAEIFLQKRIGRLNGWMGYALGFIEAKFDSINSGTPFRPKYDRRHDFKIVAQYQIDKSWQVGASFTFQSGQSYTGATSRFESRLPGRALGRPITVPSQRYGLRLPPSHQLNVNASYNFKFLGLDFTTILDIYNVYNRRDIWFRYYDTRSEVTELKDVRLLPIIPSFAVEIKF